MPSPSFTAKNYLWAAGPALLGCFRLSQFFEFQWVPEGITGLAFLLIAVAWFIRPPFSTGELQLPRDWHRVQTFAHSMGLLLFVVGIAWRFLA
jgi:hypothetical protein